MMKTRPNFSTLSKLYTVYSMLKPAFRKDEALLADIRDAQSQPQHLHIWWLGQSGFLLQYQGQHLLFDPYLSDSLSRKYANSDKPHVRLSELVVDPAHLDMIDVVTSSHNHTDHLDADTLKPMLTSNPNIQFVIPEANRAFIAERLGTVLENLTPIGLTGGTSAVVDGWVIHGVPAAHNELEVNEQGRNKFMGFVVEIGSFRVYHSGDTLWYDDMVDI